MPTKQNLLIATGKTQQLLFQKARKTRQAVFGNQVEVRSVIEYSNICRQSCQYCGMNKYAQIDRYKLNNEKAFQLVEKTYLAGRRSLLIQTGENHNKQFLHQLFEFIEMLSLNFRDLSLIGCFGILEETHYKKLRDLGVHRYILKFETADPELFKKLKPTETLRNRLQHLKLLEKYGFNIGTGNITGLPGQTLQSLVQDLKLIQELKPSMVSTSAFIPNDYSPLSNAAPGNKNTALNFMALLRIQNPQTCIPTTSSLAIGGKNGQYLGLMAGANTITLHDATPTTCEKNFVIYSSKRERPKQTLVKAIEKAGLNPTHSLIRQKETSSLYQKLILKNNPLNLAVITPESKYTYKEIHTLCDKTITLLLRKGLAEGNTLIYANGNTLEALLLFLACLRLGIIFCPVDPRMSSKALDRLAKKLKPKTIINKNFLFLLSALPKNSINISLDYKRIALILLTSGTSSFPKIVPHTFADISLKNFPEHIQLDAHDRVYSSSPFWTSFGFGNTILFPCHSGSTTLLYDGLPTETRLQEIIRHRPTILSGVPAWYSYLLQTQALNKLSLQSVRCCIVSGDTLDKKTFDNWYLQTGKKLLNCYGSTEMAHSFIANTIGKETLSCGKVLSGFEITQDKQGQLLYRGPSLTPGYLAPIEKNLRNGFWQSQDIITIKKGLIYVKKRISDRVKIHGHWVDLLLLKNIVSKASVVRTCFFTYQQNKLILTASLKPSGKGSELKTYCLKKLALHEQPYKIIILSESELKNTLNQKRSFM